MTITFKAAALVAFTLPASTLFAQATGVSHPDQTPIVTSPEGIQQPVVYERTPLPTPTAAPAKPSAATTFTPSAGAVTVVATPVPMPVVISDADANIVTRLPGTSNELPTGTLLKVRLGQSISTADTQAGSTFTAQLVESVERDGRILLPAGATLSGKITDIHGGRRISGAASIHLRPDFITLPDGTRLKLHGQVIDTDMYRQTKVDDEGTVIRRDHKAGTAAVLGLSTGAGLASGALLAGVPGAVIGAAAGAGLGTAMWLKSDRQTALPVNTKVVFTLTQSMSFESAPANPAVDSIYRPYVAPRPAGEMF